jgi:hypothetical protein
VNFFGHAVVARQVDGDPGFLLGAMAPDLLAMCGAVPGAPRSPQVVAGQANHLAVDARFHASPAFLSLTVWATGALREAGLPRGAARGAAHVGVELFLDGLLARDRAARADYLRSLEGAEALGAPFAWADAPSAERWRALVVRLRGGTILDDYRDPEFVAARLIGALGRRPRLALGPGDAVALRTFLPALQRRVTAELEALVIPAAPPPASLGDLAV